MEGDEKKTLLSSGKRQTLNNCQIFAGCVGLIMIVASVTMLAGGCDAMIQSILKRKLEVRKDSVSFSMWKKTPFPLILKVYIWNITNPEDFLEGETPNLQECGPYVWREYHEKKKMKFYDNSTVSYRQQRWWVWDAKLSGNNSRDDVIYTLNPVPLSAAWSSRHNGKYMFLLNMIFNEVNETAVVKTTVDKVLFTGFEDPMLKWIQTNVIAENGTYHFLLPILNIPSGVANSDRFGWFLDRNMSMNTDGVFSMMTGSDDIRNVGRIDMWNYTRKTKYFDPPCNQVKGSAGEFFEPGLGRENIEFYSPDLCMSMKLYYQKDVSNFGVKSYRFWGSNHTFANGSLVPANDCFCVKGICAPMGMINAESCRMGAPAFVSFPHYFNADPFLLDQVHGLLPKQEKHSFIMDIMPETGIPINVKARLQINLRVKPYPGEGFVISDKIDILKSVPDIYLPMLWFEEFADVPSNMTSKLKVLQFILSTPTVTICLSLLMFVGVVLVTTIIYVAYKVKYNPMHNDRYPNFGSVNSSGER